MDTEEVRVVTTPFHSPTGDAGPPQADGKTRSAAGHNRPQRKRVRRMSLLSITAKPMSPSEATHEIHGGGIGRHNEMSLENVLDQECEVPAAFQELQRKVERRRRRSVDTVTDDVLAFERTVNLRINDLITAISNREKAEYEKRERERTEDNKDEEGLRDEQDEELEEQHQE